MGQGWFTEVRLDCLPQALDGGDGGRHFLVESSSAQRGAGAWAEPDGVDHYHAGRRSVSDHVVKQSSGHVVR